MSSLTYRASPLSIPSHCLHPAGHHPVTLSRLGIGLDEMDMSVVNWAAERSGAALIDKQNSVMKYACFAAADMLQSV